VSGARGAAKLTFAIPKLLGAIALPPGKNAREVTSSFRKSCVTVYGAVSRLRKKIYTVRQSVDGTTAPRRSFGVVRVADAVAVCPPEERTDTVIPLPSERGVPPALTVTVDTPPGGTDGGQILHQETVPLFCKSSTDLPLILTSVTDAGADPPFRTKTNITPPLSAG